MRLLPYSLRRRFRRRRYKTSRLSGLLRIVKRGVWLGLLLLIVDAFYLYHTWPDWRQFGQGKLVKSEFIKKYEQQRQSDPDLPPLRWYPVPLTWIPKHVQRAVIVAEDSRFYSHHGVDPIALKDALNNNIEQRKIKYGGSTLSQQTIKNMYFSASRDPVRKWHELIFTLGMEFNVSKNRILNTYLNIAEFGKGVYGIEAAARHYWGVGAYNLSPLQAAKLAATLPSPVKHNPRTNTKQFQRRVKRIYKWMTAS